MAKYLDSNGLSHFMTLIKSAFALKSSVPGPYDSNPEMDGTASPGSSSLYSRGNHVHPHDTSKQDTLVSGTNIKTVGSQSLLGSGNLTPANIGAAPTSHKSTGTTYGAGDASNYGHVKLSDATNGTAAAASGGTAATPKAVSDALAAAKSYADSLDTGVTSVNGETGAVVLDKSDIGLGNVDNTADADKEVLSATKLASVINIDGVRFDGSSSIIHYFECATAASTATKTVTSPPYYNLVRGAWVAIKFTATNSAAVDNLKLQVGNTDAKPIRYRNAVLPSTDTLRANRIYLFVYDNTYWQLVGDLDTNTTYALGTTGSGASRKVTLTAGGSGSGTQSVDVPDTTYNDFTGATASAAGAHGLVPAPASGDIKRTLFGDGGWSGYALGMSWDTQSDTVELVLYKGTQSTSNELASTYLGAATARDVDTSIAADPTSANLPTTKAVADYVAAQVAGLLNYAGTRSAASGAITEGDYYIASAAFTIPVPSGGTGDPINVEAGDMIIVKTTGTSMTTANVDVVQTNIDTLTTTEIDSLWAAA